MGLSVDEPVRFTDKKMNCSSYPNNFDCLLFKVWCTFTLLWLCPSIE